MAEERAVGKAEALAEMAIVALTLEVESLALMKQRLFAKLDYLFPKVIGIPY